MSHHRRRPERMHSHYVFLALEVACERVAEADAQRLAALTHPVEPLGVRVRRAIARVALAVARRADRDVGLTTVEAR